MFYSIVINRVSKKHCKFNLSGLLLDSFVYTYGNCKLCIVKGENGMKNTNDNWHENFLKIKLLLIQVIYTLFL